MSALHLLLTHVKTPLIINSSIVLGCTLAAIFVLWIIYKILGPRLQKTEYVWDNTLLEAIYLPLQLLLLFLGLTILHNTASHFIPALAQSATHLPIARKFICVVVLTWIALRYVRFLQVNLLQPQHLKKSRLDKGSIYALCKFMRFGILIVALLSFLQIFHIPISGLLAFGGAGALVTGLAAKDVISNFLTGLMIYTDRPFTEGDWIRSPDRQIEGTVEHIGWRLTRIRKFDSRPLYVPNGIFATITIENPTRMRNRLMNQTIGLSYSNINKIVKITSEITDMLRNHDEVDQAQTISVRFVEFAESTLNINIYVSVKAISFAEFARVQENILLKVADIVKNNGASFAFPTRTIEMNNSAEKS